MNTKTNAMLHRLLQSLKLNTLIAERLDEPSWAAPAGPRCAWVEALCCAAASVDPDFETLRESIAPLDGYYLPTRSPDSLPDSIPARVYTRTVVAGTGLGLLCFPLTEGYCHCIRLPPTSKHVLLRVPPWC